MSLPPGWQRRRPSAGIEAIAEASLVAGPSGGPRRGVVVATLPRQGLSILPEAATERLDHLSAGRRVRLGEARATRYQALEADAPWRRVTLFASPATGAVVLVACSGPRHVSARFVRGCEQVAASLRLKPGRAAAPEETAEHVMTVDRTIGLLDARRAAAGLRLRRARSRPGRMKVVRALAETHAGARRALEGLPDGTEPRRASAPAIRALRDVERDYRVLMKAMRGKRSREQLARRAVRRSDARLRRAIERL